MTKRDDYNKYMREYMLRRYHERRKKAIERLGGKCKRCGSMEDIQFDHRDPKKKSFGLWCKTVSEERFEEELLKCQLLCGTCHRDKTLDDLGRKLVKGTHGSLSAYVYCGPPKCDLCRKAKTDYMREYYKRHPEKRQRKMRSKL